jgi:serine/threonine protein kinase
MGYVYKVKDKRKNQVVAVKIVRQELATDPRALKRFEQEAEAAMGLIHPNLVPVYAQGMTGDGAPYLVMEYQEGTPLDKVLKQERCIKPDRAVDICMQICDALAHAHAKGIVHRDLKPSNIVITKTKGNKDVVRIVDFGIAKVLASPESRQSIELTHTGDLFGSPSYMSPEQCMGYQLDARSDIYSLGCVMYELLSGQPPFICDNPVQTIVKHLSELPERLNRPDLASSEIPTSLASLVLRCLEKDPRNRYQSMEQLRKDLSNIQTGQRPLYARAHERASNSQPLPLVAKISVIVLIDLFCLSAAFQHYEQEVQSVADGQQAIVESGRPSGVFSDALANLRAFCATRDQFFEQRYESLTEQLPVDLYRLRSRAPHDYEYQNLVEIASEKANDGLKLLREYKTLAVDQSTNPRATENSSTAATFYTALQARQDQWLDSIASDLEKDMRNVTAEAKLHIAGSPVATSRGWLIGEVLALMLFNVMLVLGLVKSLGAETKKRTWKIGDKSF